MKQILCILFFGFLLSSYGQDFELFISKQTEESTMFEGAFTKTTDEYESGTVTLSASGPILYEVDPNSTSISTEQTKTWEGKIWADVENGPAPGSSAAASLSGDYSVDYKKDGDWVHKSGIETATFTVYSIEIQLPDDFICDCGFWNLSYYSVYPEGGEVEWQTPWGVFNGDNVPPQMFDANLIGKEVTATYTIQGLSYKATTTLQPLVPSVSANDPVCEDDQATVSLTADPVEDCATVAWAGSGTDDCGNGLECTVDLPPDFATNPVKITATYDNQCSDPEEIEITIQMAELEGFSMNFCTDVTPGNPITSLSVANLDFTEGCTPFVELDPPILNAEDGVPVKLVTVTATEGDNVFTSEIKVINPEAKLDVVNALERIEAALEYFETIDEMIETVDDLVSNYSPGLKFSIDPELEKELKLNYNLNCCKDTIVPGAEVGIAVKSSISIGAGAPIFVPPIPPPIAYVEVFIGIKLESSLGVEGELKCPPHSLCGVITLNTYGDISGKIVILAGLAHGKAGLRSNLFSGNAKICVKNADPFSYDVKGEVKFGGLSLYAQVCAGISPFEICFPEEPANFDIVSPYTIPIQYGN